MILSAICRLPGEFAQDIEQHAQDVARFLKGELSASILKARRVPRGIYEQRQNGTYMVRVRLPGGIMSVAQARALAAVASRFGSGTLHVTTRQDIQIHEVKIDQTPAVLRELFSAGLTSKGGGGNTVRNITACPYAGICPAERFDVTPSVVAVTEYLIGLAGSYNLPRKYKIAFSGCGADCALAQVNDLGFIASVRDGRQGFRVYAGGGMGAESRVADCMEEWVPSGEVIRIAEAVRRLFDRLGNRHNRRQARLRFAVAKIGADGFRGMLHEAVEAATGDGTPECDVVGDAVADPAELQHGDYRGLLSPAGGLEVLRQRQSGYIAVPLRLQLGQISWKVLDAFAAIAERFSEEKVLRATQDQNLLLRFVRESDLKALRVELDSVLGSDTASRTALQSFTACTGSAICRLGLCLSQNAAFACADALAAAGLVPETLQAVDIRINGCPNACGQHPIGTIGLFGAAHRVGERLVPAYRVLLGARRGEGRVRLGAFAGVVPARSLPVFLADLLGDFQSRRQQGEAFADYFDRQGMGYFQSIIRRHALAPDYATDPAFYRDWGRDEDFTLAGRGPGECGSGVFEVIAEDLSTAARALEPVEKDAEPDALFRSLLATSRALLITRGLDSLDPDSILRSFEAHFIDTGLVDTGFRGLLSRARGYREGWREALVDRRDEISRLFDRVGYLYSTMDAELRFHVFEETPCPQPVSPSGGSAGAAPIGKVVTAEIDLRGVSCPMNFVKAKMKLEAMEVGATLGIILDDGEPVQNVPASFRNEGQEVMEMGVYGGGQWRVVIRKQKA